MIYIIFFPCYNNLLFIGTPSRLRMKSSSLLRESWEPLEMLKWWWWGDPTPMLVPMVTTTLLTGTLMKQASTPLPPTFPSLLCPTTQKSQLPLRRNWGLLPKRMPPQLLAADSAPMLLRSASNTARRFIQFTLVCKNKELWFNRSLCSLFLYYVNTKISIFLNALTWTTETSNRYSDNTLLRYISV